MNSFEQTIAKFLTQKQLEKVQNIQIGLGGAGGLGSNCAVNLVRSGFKNFHIVDFDVVEASNLNRQFFFQDQIGMSKVEALKENLLRINPELEIVIEKQRITRANVQVFDKCDVIVEAFDQVESKQIILEQYVGGDTLVVATSGIAGWGNSDAIKVNQVVPNFYLIGDLQTAVNNDNPPMSPKVQIAAAKQADVILEWVLSNL